MNIIKQYRFTIPCLDGKRRYVFCRCMNCVDVADNGTGTAVFSTDDRRKAYVAHCSEQAEKDLAYFTEHSHGLKVEIEP